MTSCTVVNVTKPYIDSIILIGGTRNEIPYKKSTFYRKMDFIIIIILESGMIRHSFQITGYQLCRSITKNFGVFYSYNLEKGHIGNHKFTMEWK